MSLEVLLHGRVDRNLAEAHTQVAGERLGIRLGAMRRAKAGHGHGRDTGARQPQRIKARTVTSSANVESSRPKDR